MTDSVRVLLLLMAAHMDGRRMVSIPAQDLADLLNRDRRKIAERIAAAHKAGFLVTVQRGHRGQTAIYQGTFPDQ